MAIEFDPITATYYATSYTGNLTPVEPTECPPPPQEAAPPEESPPPPPQECASQEDPPPEESPRSGSLVDTVV